eukprot:TRINITY_DN635_c0_g1_i1.p1 TRINITY_DN635_c0_g1~~TRINITY_DN635_c0_g1_i1.p1  ORF type:complete len:365 (+),score=94.17 TRINITY_DN635_c0_g1_i1:94-1188(+)
MTEVYIRKVPREVDRATLIRMVESFGTVLACWTMSGKGTVKLSSEAEAALAVKAMDGTDGMVWSLEDPDSSKRKWENAARVRVQPFDPQSVTSEDLRTHFMQFGEVESIKLEDSSDEASKKIATVTFESQDAATKALKHGIHNVNFDVISVVPAPDEASKRSRHVPAPRERRDWRDLSPTKKGPNTGDKDKDKGRNVGEDTSDGEPYLVLQKLPVDLDTKGLETKLAAHGTVLACRVVFNEKGKSARFGFATMQNGAEAREAVSKLHGVNGQVVKIASGDLYKKKEEQKEAEHRERVEKKEMKERKGGNKGKGKGKGKGDKSEDFMAGAMMATMMAMMAADKSSGSGTSWGQSSWSSNSSSSWW